MGTSAMISSSGFPIPKITPSLKRIVHFWMQWKDEETTWVFYNQMFQMTLSKNKVENVIKIQTEMNWSVQCRKKENKQSMNVVFFLQLLPLQVFLWNEFHNHAFVFLNMFLSTRIKNEIIQEIFLWTNTSCFLISSSHVLIFFSICSRTSAFVFNTNLNNFPMNIITTMSIILHSTNWTKHSCFRR